MTRGTKQRLRKHVFVSIRLIQKHNHPLSEIKCRFHQLLGALNHHGRLFLDARHDSFNRMRNRFVDAGVLQLLDIDERTIKTYFFGACVLRHHKRELVFALLTAHKRSQQQNIG